MKENVGEAEGIIYCRKISKPSESGFQEMPGELREHTSLKYDLPGKFKGQEERVFEGLLRELVAH